MTKKQRREHKLGNALRAAHLTGSLKLTVAGGWVLKDHQTATGLAPRINRAAERIAEARP